MSLVKSKEKFAGGLVLLGMLAGVFSVAPAIDSAGYLTEAAANTNQVIVAAICQFTMALAYVGMAVLLYPFIKSLGRSLSIGFLSLRIIAATLVVVGTVLLLSILSLSQEFVANPSQDAVAFDVLGAVLRATRDHINHVLMILVLCTGNLLFYILLLKSVLIPRWLSIWGLIGNLLSVVASLLVLFQFVDIITTEYLVLNAPTAVQELTLGIWLIVKGFDRRFIDTGDLFKILMILFALTPVSCDMKENTNIEMVLVEGGTFMMGGIESNNKELMELMKEEFPVHDVTVNDFYVGQYEVI